MNERRVVEYQSTTLETHVQVSLDLDGDGRGEVSTGIGFLDHLLSTLARHARFDLKLSCRGDLRVDDAHPAPACQAGLTALTCTNAKSTVPAAC